MIKYTKIFYESRGRMKGIQAFREYTKKIEDMRHAAMIISWDMETKMPKNGAEAHIASLTLLSSESFKMMVADEMKGYLDELTTEESMSKLTAIDKKMIENMKESYDEVKNIPPELHTRLVEVQSRSQHAWKTAKHANDFETMIPYFEEMIALSKEVSRCIKPEQDPYDTLLDSYEKGMTAEKISRVFTELRDGIQPLIEAISKKPRYDDCKFKGEYSKEAQKALAHDILHVMGYNFDSGRLDESEHPFTIGDAPHDVRITTNYDVTDMRPSLFSVLHEGGHALYEQHINPLLVGTFLNRGTSMGIHESQSRFYENIIGRNKYFWENHYHQVVKRFPAYKDISLDAFYKSINSVEPSLIRVDADELTYNLHVIIRFELERALFDGTLSVKDLPQAWGDKMKAYLGVEPGCHKDGVLQDMHWPNGMFGYFPSYALGNIYSGQFLMQLEKERGSIDELLKEDKMGQITEWLEHHIHQHGGMKKPIEIIQDTCGTGLDAKPIIKYYTEKYTAIYGL